MSSQDAKVGLLVGREEQFPRALIDRINAQRRGVTAEMVRLSGTRLDEPIPYRVIIDRISHEVPYYRIFLTKAVADGVIVVNNPFWWSADNKFFECVLAERLGIAVPRTVALPNKAYEADIIDQSLRNLVSPIPWRQISAYTGLPAVLKPATGGGSRDVTVVETVDDLIAAYERSRFLSMILQEKIEYQAYVRCFCIARQHVQISGYDFSRSHYERFRPQHDLTPVLYEQVAQHCLTLTRALGYDIDTLEFAVRDGVPVAIDFLNPAPDAESTSIGEANFNWVVGHVADLAIRYAAGDEPVPPALEWRAMVAHVPSLAQPAGNAVTS